MVLSSRRKSEVSWLRYRRSGIYGQATLNHTQRGEATYVDPDNGPRRALSTEIDEASKVSYFYFFLGMIKQRSAPSREFLAGR